jgi:DNA-binding transcriptional LysR family regulator
VILEEIEPTSVDILRDLAIFELDAAITYLEDEPLERVRALPIATDRHVLVLPEGSPLAEVENVTWAQAATLPLCLHRPDMQNRCIIDNVFTSRSLMYWLQGLRGVRVVPLVEPEITKTVGLVIADRDPIPALIRAFWQHVERLDVLNQFAHAENRA